MKIFRIIALAALAAPSAAPRASAGELALAENSKALVDVIVEARSTYDLGCSVQDLLFHLEKMTGAKFSLVKKPKPGRKLIRIANDASLAEQESLVRVTQDGVELLGSDRVEYAIYDFLRHFCGCNWLDPTEAGEIIPRNASLAVKTGERRDRPYCLARRNSGIFTTYNPLLWRTGTPGWTNYVKCAYSAAYAKGGFKAAVAAMNFSRTRFKRRMKAQGRNATANHSFYWFNDRFLDRKNPRFIEFRPEYFAKGYTRKEDANKKPEDIYSDWDPRKAPPQMCYSHEGFFRQTLEDVRAYFDNGGYTNRYTNVGWAGPVWGADTYCLEPHDNEAFCRCPDCIRQYRDDRAAERGRHSDYWFGFVNRVAKEIAKTHPGKKISTLAYGSGREAKPSFKLEPNVVVHFCYSCNRMPNSETKLTQERLLREWHDAYPGNAFGVWLYNCFPQERTVRPGGFNCFPGFFGSMLAAQYRFLKEMNVKDIIFNCGMTDDFESFLTFRLMWNPDEDYSALKDEWFSSFGAAEPSIRKFYDLVEKRFCDKANYPEKSGHQTILVAWGHLGTARVMEDLSRYMAEAEKTADTPLAKARVANWKAGVWLYMLEGKRQKNAFDAQREGVTGEVVYYLGAEPPAFGENLLSGAPVSAACKGVWHAIYNKGKSVKKYSLGDLPVLTDGDFKTSVWMNGHPVTNLVVKAQRPVKNLTRLRLTFSFGDFLRSCAIVKPVGFKGGRVVDLAGEFRQTKRPNPNWKETNDDTRSFYTLEWNFAPGSVPEELDAVGYVDAGVREKWYSPRICEIEAEGTAGAVRK